MLVLKLLCKPNFHAGICFNTSLHLGRGVFLRERLLHAERGEDGGGREFSKDHRPCPKPADSSARFPLPRRSDFRLLLSLLRASSSGTAAP